MSMFKQLLKMTTPIFLLFYSMACGAETSATIEVSAQIEAGCVFQQSPIGLNFGIHASTAQESTVTANISNTQQTWKIECTPNTPVNITFGNGKSVNTQTQNRRLKHNSAEHYLDYMLYQDANLSQPIGTTSNNTLTKQSTAQNYLLDFQIYGVVDLSQGAVNKMPGQYTDDVLITITW